jgi:hypothetical protein
MKYSAVSAALVGSAMAAGAADNVNQVLNDISSAIKSFDSSIKGYGGGDAAQLNAAAAKIQTITASGAKTIAGGPDLTLNDALSITTNVNGLQTILDSTLSDLEGIGSKLASAGQCGSIQSQLSSQADAAKALQNAIADKAPTETKPVAIQLGGQVGASIQKTQGKFKEICANAPSAPSGGSSSGADHSAGGHSSSGSGSGSSSGSSTTGSSSTGTKGSKAGASSTAPKPAVYTGAASQLAYSPVMLGAIVAIFAL